ncbi:methylmalonyl-CoA mutase family protein, partial [Algoriphagus sp.]
MRPDFNSWKKPSVANDTLLENLWDSPEQIQVPPSFDPATLKLAHVHFVAGIPPYLRGPYSTMYVMRPWTIRQYAGFSTAEES